MNEPDGDRESRGVSGPGGSRARRARTDPRTGGAAAPDGAGGDDAGVPHTTPSLKSYRTILEQEIHFAEEELRRPTVGLLASGLIAGIGVGTSVLLMAIVLTLAGGDLAGPGMAVLMASAYAVGFIIVILGRTDLFTEYTTIAALPSLTGRSGIRPVARVWGLVYVSNIVGAVAFAALLAALGPRLGIVDGRALDAIARRLVRHDAAIMLASATLAGWLMGLLSWLVTASRDTIGQIIFVWLIAATIGIGHLHHCVVGTVEVLAGAFADRTVDAAVAGEFLLWTTLGNAVGGVLFAVLIRFSAITRSTGRHDRGTRRRTRR